MGRSANVFTKMEKSEKCFYSRTFTKELFIIFIFIIREPTPTTALSAGVNAKERKERRVKKKGTERETPKPIPGN